MPPHDAGEPATSAGAGAKAPTTGAESPSKIRILTQDEKKELYDILVEKNIADRRKGNVKKRRDALVAFLEDKKKPDSHYPKDPDNFIREIIREFSQTGDSADGAGGDDQQEAGVGGKPSGSSARKRPRYPKPKGAEGADLTTMSKVQPDVDMDGPLKALLTKFPGSVAAYGGHVLERFDSCGGDQPLGSRESERHRNINIFVDYKTSLEYLGEKANKLDAVNEFFSKFAEVAQETVMVDRRDTEPIGMEVCWAEKAHNETEYFGRYHVTCPTKSTFSYVICFGGWSSYQRVLEQFNLTITQIAMVYEQDKFVFKCLKGSSAHIESSPHKLHLTSSALARLKEGDRQAKLLTDIVRKYQNRGCELNAEHAKLLPKT